jgi:hypothetical protein
MVMATHLPQHLVVVAVLLVHQEKCQWAVPESVLHVLSAILRMSLATVHVRNVLRTSTKIKWEQPTAYDAWKERLQLLDPVNAHRVVVVVEVGHHHQLL